MPKPFIPPMKGNKTPFVPNQPKPVGNRPPIWRRSRPPRGRRHPRRAARAGRCGPRRGR